MFFERILSARILDSMTVQEPKEKIHRQESAAFGSLSLYKLQAAPELLCGKGKRTVGPDNETPWVQFSVKQ